jgi:hypothetical protein
MRSKTLTMTSFSLLSSTMRVVTPVPAVCAAAVAALPAAAAPAAASVSAGCGFCGISGCTPSIANQCMLKVGSAGTLQATTQPKPRYEHRAALNRMCTRHHVRCQKCNVLWQRLLQQVVKVHDAISDKEQILPRLRELQRGVFVDGRAGVAARGKEAAGIVVAAMSGNTDRQREASAPLPFLRGSPVPAMSDICLPDP